jgi:hypothetical protein
MSDARWPKLGAWRRYNLTAAAYFMRAAGWCLRSHVLVIGPLALCLVWRERMLPEASALYEDVPR